MGSDINCGRCVKDLLAAWNQADHPSSRGLLSREACSGVPFAAAAFSLPCYPGRTAASFAAAVGNSVFLKPAQSLLEETVSVGGEAVGLCHGGRTSRSSPRSGRSLGRSSELKAESCGDGFSYLEQQRLRSTIAGLITLLEEVDGRYEDYRRQMEAVESSFEAVAGRGAARSYTALALRAMSGHFSGLRDAILSQIDSTRRRASEVLPGRASHGLSRLALLDRESPQNRLAIQLPGRRPVRGLPEASAAILRAWLFEHFLHPYPNDYEKLMLASQTGLTKNQVSNWFINARVRLWKPMIEEMYREELADSSVLIESDPLFEGSD